MTDGSLFNMDAFQDAAVQDDPATGPEAAPDTLGLTPAARDAAAPKSLYRKYRPRSFDADDLFGQEHIVNTLRNAIALDRIAHAYLFCGPRGTGKTTTARLLAKAVNCLDPEPANRPCNSCGACVSINTGASTDVIEIDAASNRGIDDIRDLRERVRYTPSQLRTKFYIIDEAHQITGAAANAFLKTLEEPPAHTKFILATTDPEELLQTIVSRCQRFDFRRISLDAMVACITKVARSENITIEEGAKTAIARHATGSMRDALGLLDQVAVYRENRDDENTTVTADLVRTVLGVSKNDRVEQIAAALADKDAGAGVCAVGEAVEAGDDIRQLARQLLAYLRLLLLERAGGTVDLDETGKALAGRFALGELTDLTRLMGDIDFKVRHATISQLPLEIAIIEGALRDQKVQQDAGSVPQKQVQQAPPEMSADHVSYSPPATQQQSAPTQPRTSLRDRVRGGPGSWSSNGTRNAQAMSQPGPADSGQAPQQQGQQQTSRPGQEPASLQAQQAAAPTPPQRGNNAASLTSNGVLAIESLIDGWPRIRADVKAVNRRIEALLQQIDPIAINGNKVTLVSPYEFHRNRVNSDEVRNVVEEVIQRQFGEKITVTCVTRDEATALAQQQQPPTDPPRAESAPASPAREPSPVSTTVQNDPAPEETTDPPPSFEDDERTIQAVKNIFDAEEE